VHPVPEVPVTVYRMEESGVAETPAVLVLFRPLDGLQEYDAAPDAVKLLLEPGQIVSFPVILIVGRGLMKTVTVSDASQPDESVPVTV